MNLRTGLTALCGSIPFVLKVLPKLDRQIEEVHLSSGTALVKMKNGLKYTAPPEQGTLTVITFPGCKKVNKLKDHGEFLYILAEQFIDNRYEKHHEVKRGDIVVDIGANIGVFTVDAARKVGDEGKVIAIEPEKMSANFLKKNVQLNNVHNVDFVQKGTWSERTKAKLYQKGIGQHNLFQEQADYTLAELDRLDHILEEQHIEKIDLIKADIEGAEVEMLKGAHKTLTECPDLAIAAYHQFDKFTTYEDVVSILEREGFSVVDRLRLDEIEKSQNNTRNTTLLGKSVNRLQNIALRLVGIRGSFAAQGRGIVYATAD